MSGRRPKSLSAIIDDLLNRISKKDDYNIFAELVSKELYPHYWQTVASPTAISVMREKNNRSFYRNLDDFKAEFDLMIQNCCAYNPDTTLYHKEALKLKKNCESMIIKAAPMVDANTSVNSGGPLSSQATIPAPIAAAVSDDDDDEQRHAVKKAKISHMPASGSRPSQPPTPDSRPEPPSPMRPDVARVTVVAAAPPPPAAPSRIVGNRIIRQPMPDDVLTVVERVMQPQSFSTTAEQCLMWRRNTDLKRVHAVGVAAGRAKAYSGPPGPVASTDVITALSLSCGVSSAAPASLDGPKPTSFPGCFARSLKQFLGSAPPVVRQRVERDAASDYQLILTALPEWNSVSA